MLHVYNDYNSLKGSGGTGWIIIIGTHECNYLLYALKLHTCTVTTV